MSEPTVERDRADRMIEDLRRSRTLLDAVVAASSSQRRRGGGADPRGTVDVHGARERDRSPVPVVLPRHDEPM
ncbi:hypothetical protein ACWGPD_29660 [Streptomyces hirsutus]|uniref:hypothetical protein n=1 Tax=Streptomyces hirsutus TaxID=35620 RepID=UPI003320082A